MHYKINISSKYSYILVLFFVIFSTSFSQVQTGLDVLIDDNFDILEGKSVGLLTNYTAVSSHGDLAADVLSSNPKFRLNAIFTPEHGFYANHSAGDPVDDESMFGVPLYSLYGANRKPTPKQLAGCDVIVVDIQDIGIRSYTYISSMYKMMEACGEEDIPIVVLDRPNPLGGLIVDGCTITKGFESFVGIVPVSYIHGCTIGEIARMTNDEGWLPEKDGKHLRCFLTVIKMKNWDRSMTWEETGLPWLPTSPNIPTVDAARGAAMLGVFGELGTIGIGIGTSLPFQYIGSTTFETDRVSNELNSLCFPGVTLHPVRYKSSFAKATAKMMNGYLLKFNNDNEFMPFSTGVEIMLAIRRIHPEIFNRDAINEQGKKMFIKVCGSEDLMNALIKKASDEYVRKIARKGLTNYLKIREKYLIY